MFNVRVVTPNGTMDVGPNAPVPTNYRIRSTTVDTAIAALNRSRTLASKSWHCAPGGNTCSLATQYPARSLLAIECKLVKNVAVYS